MTFSPTSKQVVLQEKFDESSEPTNEEIIEYALKIGIDIEHEAKLLPFARDCLMQPLPEEWSPCYDADHPDRIYYFNFKTGRAQWIHPLEQVHRKLVIKARSDQKPESSFTEQADDDSRTTVKEDLRSFEEALTSESQRSAMIPKPRLLEPLAPIPPRGALRKPPDTLGPLKTAAPATPAEVKKVSFDEVKKRPNSSDIRNRRNIGPLEFRHLSKQEIITPKPQWRDEGYGTESSITQPPMQLTLSGGGAMFLKKKPLYEEVLSKPSVIEKIDKHDKENDSYNNEDKNSVSLKLEKELRVNFEAPKESEASKSSEAKHIEIDFEELEMKLDTSLGKDNAKEPNSSRNFKKSINIVLNGHDERKNDNLIDWTDSVSTVESKAEDVIISKSILSDLENLLKASGAQDDLPNERTNELLSEKPSKASFDWLNEKPKVSLSPLEQKSDSKVSSESPKRQSQEETLEKTRVHLETAKAEKLKSLEGDFNEWVRNTEKMFREKEKQFYSNMMEHYEDLKKNDENEMIKEIADKCAEELQGKVKSLKNELLRKEQEALDSLRMTLAAQTRDKMKALREEIETKEEKELSELKITLEGSLAKKKDELYRKHQEEMTKLERNLEALLAEQRVQREKELEKAREDESALAAMRAQLKDAFLEQKTILQQEHEMAMQKLRQQHELELFQAANNRPIPTETDSKANKDASDLRVYEKLRCEKRLLEDKYRSLKEKYIRLKGDVKLTLERKAKKKEQSASETDPSQSHKSTDSPKLKLNHLDNVNQNIAQSKNARAEVTKEPLQQVANGSSGDEGENPDNKAARKRRQFFSKLKAASTSRLNSKQQVEDPMSPVESLRRQLKKLEELEDQFPVTPHTDTYLRYPFTDAATPHFASSELEFFKHRIHLERDAVRRAKEFLKAQKKCYENRQKELQHRLTERGPSSRSIVEKIHQEERELTEMEVSVHRTRALLGEKIIRLRHLEQSLKRAAPAERKGVANASREDGTLSDLSSHSESSGFSSHHTSEPLGPRLVLDKNKRHLHMQESNEIIQSLENLNSEIRGIWEVLKQSSSPGTVQLPPPPLAWPAVRSNPTASLLSPRPMTQVKTQVSSVGQVTTIVDPTLVDRTRSLRDWLKSTRRSPNNQEQPSNQVTL